MSADVPHPPVGSIGPWGAGEGELKTQKLGGGLIRAADRTATISISLSDAKCSPICRESGGLARLARRPVTENSAAMWYMPIHIIDYVYRYIPGTTYIAAVSKPTYLLYLYLLTFYTCA